MTYVKNGVCYGSSCFGVFFTGGTSGVDASCLIVCKDICRHFLEMMYSSIDRVIECMPAAFAEMAALILIP